MPDEVIHDETNQKFYIKHPDDESYLKYNLENNNTIDFLSTFVPHKYRNKGLASKIVIEGLNYARNRNLKVIPTCSFTRDLIASNDEFKDLLK